MLDADVLNIVSYGYEVWRSAEKLYWYDSQPHPDDPTLVSTHPHHIRITNTFRPASNIIACPRQA